MYRSVRVDDSLVLVVSGPFDGAVAPPVHIELEAALTSGVDEVLIDLCDATEVDDGAIAVLCAAAGQLLGGGGVLFIARDAETVVEIHDPSLVRSVFG